MTRSETSPGPCDRCGRGTLNAFAEQAAKVAEAVGS